MLERYGKVLQRKHAVSLSSNLKTVSQISPYDSIDTNITWKKLIFLTYKHMS